MKQTLVIARDEIFIKKYDRIPKTSFKDNDLAVYVTNRYKFFVKLQNVSTLSDGIISYSLMVKIMMDYKFILKKTDESGILSWENECVLRTPTEKERNMFYKAFVNG